MSKTGPLANTEKYKIQQLLMKGKNVEEISASLDRPASAVENYINGELSSLLESVQKVEDEQVDEENAAVIKKVGNRLVQNGITSKDATKLIKKAIQVTKQAGEEIEENRLYSRCIAQMRTGEFIIKKTSSGNSGVGIMTSMASERSDMSKGRRRKASEKVRGNVYQPSTGKYVD